MSRVISALFLILTLPLGALAKSGDEFDVKALSCAQLEAEANLAELKLNQANRQMNQSNSAYRHSNPYGQSDPTMSAFQQGLASSRRIKSQRMQNEAMETVAAVSREYTTRCGQTGAAPQQNIDPEVHAWIAQSVYFKKDPFLTKMAVIELDKLLLLYPNSSTPSLLPLLDDVMMQSYSAQINQLGK